MRKPSSQLSELHIGKAGARWDSVLEMSVINYGDHSLHPIKYEMPN